MVKIVSSNPTITKFITQVLSITRHPCFKLQFPIDLVMAIQSTYHALLPVYVPVGELISNRMPKRESYLVCRFKATGGAGCYT